jgi:hypothetical protein
VAAVSRSFRLPCVVAVASPAQKWKKPPKLETNEIIKDRNSFI